MLISEDLLYSLFSVHPTLKKTLLEHEGEFSKEELLGLFTYLKRLQQSEQAILAQAIEQNPHLIQDIQTMEHTQRAKMLGQAESKEKTDADEALLSDLQS